MLRFRHSIFFGQDPQVLQYNTTRYATPWIPNERARSDGGISCATCFRSQHHVSLPKPRRRTALHDDHIHLIPDVGWGTGTATPLDQPTPES